MTSKIQRWLTLMLVITIISSFALVGCAAPQDNSSTAQTDITAQSSSQNTSALPKLEGKATVVMTVKGSPITIEVNGNDAPFTAGNFVDLVERGVYDGLVFHRVIREPDPFVVQGGDPQGKEPSFPIERLGSGSFIDPETGNPRYVRLEIKPEGAQEPIYSKVTSQPPVLKHSRGAVAMARSQAPDSASSQFYFALADLDFLDGKYAVFGYVTSGMEVVDQIQQGDRIESAKVTEGAENLQK